MLDEGVRLKEEGLSRTSASHKRELIYARKVAVAIAKKNRSGCVSIHDVDKVYMTKGMDLYSELGMACGALFRTGEWTKTYYTDKAGRERSHKRPVTVWRYTGA